MARFKTSQPHFDSGFAHGELRIADTDFAEVENAGGKHGIRFAFFDAINQMLNIADAS